MTSNLGAESFGQEPFGLARGSIRDAAEHFTEEVRAFLRPEVFNRIDRIIPFLPLDPKAIRSIADRELELIRRRDGIALRGLDLRVTPEALESLAQGGYDARYGARPLKRTLERELLAPLAEAVNGHGVDVPLEASVECAADAKTGAKVVVRVRAKGTLERREMQEISPQQRVLNLRRVVQQLGRCAAVTSMHNDIFQLERQIERAEARQRNLPEMAEWRERLKRLGAPAQELKDLQAQVAEMEDTILANFYGGPAGSWPAVMLLGNAELKFTTLQKTVYGLRFADPDHIVLGLFAEDRQRLFELARIYHQLARQRTWKVEAAWFARDKRGLLRHREEAEACLATVKPEAIGLALGIDGPEALPWFEGEGGGHLFAGRQNKATCVVTMSTVPLVDMEPPEAAGRADGLPPVAVRREYDLEKSLIRDKALDLETRWTDLGMAVGNLMDERLKRAIWEMLNE
jgi:ATP-dependent Clp protease ATP-binding subunit ClpC